MLHSRKATGGKVQYTHEVLKLYLVEIFANTVAASSTPPTVPQLSLYPCFWCSGCCFSPHYLGNVVVGFEVCHNVSGLLPVFPGHEVTSACLLVSP